MKKKLKPKYSAALVLKTIAVPLHVRNARRYEQKIIEFGIKLSKTAVACHIAMAIYDKFIEPALAAVPPYHLKK